MIHVWDLVRKVSHSYFTTHSLFAFLENQNFKRLLYIFIHNFTKMNTLVTQDVWFLKNIQFFFMIIIIKQLPKRKLW